MWRFTVLLWIVILWGGYVEVLSEVTTKDTARKICVHRGKGIQLFSKTDVNQCKEVFLYVKVIDVQIAATWSLKNGIIISGSTYSIYSGRINMTKNGNIWILDVEEQDAGIYSLKCDSQKEGPEVDLTVLEKLTEEQQIQECLTGHLHFTEIHSETRYSMNATQLWKKFTEGINHNTTITQRQKDHTEGINYSTTMSDSRKEVTKGNKHDTTTAQRQKDDTEGSSCSEMYYWIKVIAVAMCLLVSVIAMAIIGVGFVWMLYIRSEKMITEDQVQNWLNNHPDVMMKYLGTPSRVENKVQTDTTLQAIDAKISEKSNSQLQRRRKQRLSANIQSLDPREDNTDGTDMQSISIDDQKARPEGDKPQPKSVESFGVPVKEDSNSDEECKKPLIVVHGDQNPKAIVTFYDV